MVSESKVCPFFGFLFWAIFHYFKRGQLPSFWFSTEVIIPPLHSTQVLSYKHGVKCVSRLSVVQNSHGRPQQHDDTSVCWWASPSFATNSQFQTTKLMQKFAYIYHWLQQQIHKAAKNPATHSIFDIQLISSTKSQQKLIYVSDWFQQKTQTAEIFYAC